MSNGFRKFLIGTALGAGAGLLLAPHSGRKTRRIVRNGVTTAGKDVVGTGRYIYKQGKDVGRYVGRTVHRIAA
jgi:gas vesicle protein